MTPEMKITCDWEVHGSGTGEVDLSQIDDLTRNSLEMWIIDGVHDFEIRDKMNYTVSLNFSCSDDELEEALEAERKEREADG